MLHALAQHRYLLLFATAFVNQVVLFVPVVPFLVSAGALAARHQVELGGTIAALALGVAPADLVWYALGRRTGGRLLARVCRVALEPDGCVRSTKNVFSRYGARVFVIAKFVPGLSTVAMPLAGVLGMRARRFAAYDGAGALVWTSAYVLVGYAGASQLMAMTGRAHPRAWTVAAAAAIVAYPAWRIVQRRRFTRALRTKRIEPAELQRKLQAGEPVVVLDLRHAIDVQADPHAIPGSLHIPAEELRRRACEIPRDREVVLYCT